MTMNALTVKLKSVIEMTDEQFFQLCQNNRELRFERNANGELIIMPPTGGETGNKNARITQQLMNWTDADGTGILLILRLVLSYQMVQIVLLMLLGSS